MIGYSRVFELILNKDYHNLREEIRGKKIVEDEFTIMRGISKGWMTPLLSAVDKQDETAVAILLEHGEDPNGRCTKGAPLHIASRKANARIMELLLEAGALYEKSSFNGETVMDALVYGPGRFYYSSKTEAMKEVGLDILMRFGLPPSFYLEPILSYLVEAPLAVKLIEAGADYTLIREKRVFYPDSMHLYYSTSVVMITNAVMRRQTLTSLAFLTFSFQAKEEEKRKERPAKIKKV